MAIESSDLQAEGRRDNVIVLNAVIRNQAQFAQEFPALELTLTDERDEAVARRVLQPADYLSGVAPARIAQGIGAGADQALRLYLDTSGLRAVGYRMYLFFP
jgi:pheromone shutdown protein TraB